MKSETISQLAHRHLLNQNHTTTDEELRNARIEFNDSFDISIPELSDINNTGASSSAFFNKKSRTRGK